MVAFRFLTVVGVGLVLDLSIAYTLATQLALPLGTAAIIGFVSAASVNYGLHEFWTFRHGARQFSMRRAAQYVGTCTLTLLARLAAVAWLSTKFGPDYALAILICAVGTSFLINFTISKVLIFSRVSAEMETTS